ncbi:MAG: signal recognition particle receptor subunit alpha, partial [Anaerovoracaceae bacterium]
MAFGIKKSFFGRMSERISEAIKGKNEVDDELLDEMEEILITSDIGMETTMHIMDRLRGILKNESITSAKSVNMILKKIMINLVDKGERQALSKDTPLVILMIGINGGGKTT